MMRKLLLASALSVMTVGAAQAGEQYVDETGYAISGYDAVAYFDLKQNPVGSEQPRAVRGKAGITAEYNGATWAFARSERTTKRTTRCSN